MTQKVYATSHAMMILHHAVKQNNNDSVIKTILSLQIDADCHNTLAQYLSEDREDCDISHATREELLSCVQIDRIALHLDHVIHNI